MVRTEERGKTISFRADSNAMERKIGSAGESAHPEAKSLATKRYTLHRMLNMLTQLKRAWPSESEAD